jgi:hypothetical protein
MSKSSMSARDIVRLLKGVGTTASVSQITADFAASHQSAALGQKETQRKQAGQRPIGLEAVW